MSCSHRPTPRGAPAPGGARMCRDARTFGSAVFRAGMALGALALLAHPVTAQDGHDLEGRWEGSLTVLGNELPFSVTFSRGDDGLAATMDIPAQGAAGLPLINVSYADSRVHFELDAPIGLAVWDGVLEGDAIEGEFTQGGARGTFRIARGDTVAAAEDAPPVPYREEELTFENGELHFEGTLTLPEGPGPFAAAVMITGSGPQNRDEELVGFRPFRVIADHLTRAGIAVFRYDDRGVGGSTGSVAQSTTADFATDVSAAMARLARHPEIDAARIGLIGHSEGAVVAPLVASRSDGVAFLVLLAGTSVTGAEVIYEQSALIARAQGVPEADIARQMDFQRRMFAALAAGEDLAPLREELTGLIRAGIERLPAEQRAAITDVDALVAQQVRTQTEQVGTPWFRYFLTYDPVPALRATDVPVLALFGALDLQVAPAQNREPMAAALAHNPDVTIEVIPGANHLFQAATTGSPMEYASLEKAFVPGFLERIATWIRERAGG